MADKKKPNYANALRGISRTISPPTMDIRTSDESVEVDVGGQAVKVLRGDMTEAEWANVKKRALPSKSTSMKDKPLGWSDLMGLAQNLDGVADTVVSKEQKELLKKTDEWTRAEYLRKRFKNEGYEVPPNSADDERASYKDGKKAEPSPEKATVIPSTVEYDTAKDAGVTKPAQGSPDEWKPMPTKQQNQGGPGTQTEDDPMVGMGGSMRNPASFVPQMALGATGNPMLDAVGSRAGEVADTMSNAAAQGKSAQEAASPVNMVKEQVDQRVFGDKPLIPGAVKQLVKQLPQAIGAGAATDVGSLLQWTGQAAGMPNMAKTGANISNNAVMPPAWRGHRGLRTQSAAAPKPPPGELPMTQQPPTPEMGGSGGMSASASLLSGMPSGFRVEQADPNAKAEYDKARAGARAQIENAQDMQEALGIARDGAVREASKRQMVVEEEAAKLASLASQAKLNAVQEARRIQGAQAAVVEEARRAAAEPTDPNRYWNNKNEGQKAAAVIAGALFGFTGQGMQWLQRIDGLIESDMNAQRADRASKVQGLNAEASYLGQAAQQAMANGATVAEAHLLERQAKYEGLKSYLDIMSMKMTNMDQKARAAQMSAELGMKSAALGEQAYALADQAANRKTEWNYKNAALAQDAAKTRATLAMKEMGGKGGEQLRGPQVQNINDMMDAIKSAKNMSTEFKSKAAGFLSKLSALDPTGTTGASEYNAKRDVVVQLVGRALEGGVLREGDIARYLKMIPAAGDLRGAERWDQLIKEMEQRLVTNLQGFSNAGFDVGGLPRQASGVLAPPTPDIPETPFE